MNSYIHIPFCRQKCPYCKFALTPIFDEHKKKKYLQFLKKEVTSFFQKQNSEISVDTIYFGGGTPSILSPDEIKSILECFHFSHDTQKREITLECNPEDITIASIAGTLAIGINRISLGVQSLNNTTLTAIHRGSRENILDALRSITIVTKTIPISLNIDFILGLPYSGPGETLENIKYLHKKFPNITHTSVYMLEEGLYPKEWKKSSIQEQEMGEEYKNICDYFDTLGWNHYEISNWSMPGYESIHNQGYWNHTNTKAFGLSGTSYEEERRYRNSSSFSGYYAGKIDEEELLTQPQIAMEKLIFSLRTFSLDTETIHPEKQRVLLESGLIQIEKGKILLTPAGIFRENTIIASLI